MINLFVELIKFLHDIWNRHVGSSPEKNIKKLINIYDEMHRILNETEVKRLLILKAHNGGGVIKPSGNLYVSVLYEDYTHPFFSVKDQYQSLAVDKDYAKMLVDIINSKKVIMKVEDMADCVLKRLYMKEGVRSAVGYYLGQDKKSVYFCTFSNELDLPEWFYSGQEASCEIAVSKFRQNIK